jgi:hypothetical protein
MATLAIDYVQEPRKQLRYRMGMEKHKRQGKATSKYKGVSRKAGNLKRPWAAAIKLNGQTYHLGLFATEEQAGLAYNEAAKRLFMDYARLNVIEEK